MASPPTAIMPLPVVVAEGCVALAAERITTPVISDSHVASTIIGGVPGPVDREVSVSVDRNVVANTINVRVLCAVHRGVSFTIRLKISGLINRDVSVAIDRKISLTSCS
jgi:hypothetical protein